MNDKHIAKAREILLEIMLCVGKSKTRMSPQEAEAWVYVIAKVLAQTEAEALTRADSRGEE